MQNKIRWDCYSDYRASQALEGPACLVCPTLIIGDMQSHTLQAAGQLHWGQISGLEGTSSRGLGQTTARFGKESHRLHGISMAGCTGTQGGPNNRLPISSNNVGSFDNKRQLSFLSSQPQVSQLAVTRCVRPHLKTLRAITRKLRSLLGNSQGAKPKSRAP